MFMYVVHMATTSLWRVTNWNKLSAIIPLMLTSFYLVLLRVEGCCYTWPHSITHTHTHSVGLLCMSDRPVTETSTWQQHNDAYSLEAAFHPSIRKKKPSPVTGIPPYPFVAFRFAKLRKSTISFVMLCLPLCLSVPPSAWNNSSPTGQIFVKFLYFSKICKENPSLYHVAQVGVVFRRLPEESKIFSVPGW